MTTGILSITNNWAEPSWIGLYDIMSRWKIYIIQKNECATSTVFKTHTSRQRDKWTKWSHRHIAAMLCRKHTNKSPKGHWSLTWVQWALLLKVRFLSKSESTTAIFVKSVRTATIAIFQFRIWGCIQFVAVAFRSEEEVLWRRNPSLTYFWQIAPPWIRP